MSQDEKTCVTCQWMVRLPVNAYQPRLPYLCRSPKVGANPVTGLLRFSWCQDQRDGGPTAEYDYRCAGGLWWEPKPEVRTSSWLAGRLRRMRRP